MMKQCEHCGERYAAGTELVFGGDEKHCSSICKKADERGEPKGTLLSRTVEQSPPFEEERSKCKRCGDEFRKEGNEADEWCSAECYFALRCDELEAQVAELEKKRDSLISSCMRKDLRGAKKDRIIKELATRVCRGIHAAVYDEVVQKIIDTVTKETE